MKAFTPIWKSDTITLESIEAVIGLLSQELAAIASDASEESIDGRRRVILKNRVDLLRQLGETLSRRQELLQARNDKGRPEAELDAKIREWEKKPPPVEPVNPTQESFKILDDKRNERLKAVKALQETRDRRRQLIQRMPDMILQARQTQKAAEDELRKLPVVEGKTDVANKNLLTMKADNATLSLRLSQEQVALWNAELAFEKENGVRQDKELELAQRVFEWEEAQFKLYQEALNRLQTHALVVKVDALAQKEKDAEQARTPQEKFLSQWEILVAQTQKNIADWQQLRTEVASVITVQESRIKEESAELGKLEALVKRLGSQGMAAELLKSTFRLMSQRRQDLERVIPATMRARLSLGQTRRVEIETRLVDLREQWQAELVAAQGTGHDPHLKEKAIRFLDAYRQGLLDEKRVLFEINVDERRLELLTVERSNVLDGLERFVLSKVFWIQDADPIGLNLISGLIDEIGGADRENSVLRWMARLFSVESLQGLQAALYRPIVLMYGQLLVLALLFGIPLSRRWIRSMKDWRMPQEHRTFVSWLLPFWAAFAEAVWWSIYFLLAALFFAAAGLPEGVGHVLARILTHLALFFFLWRFNRRVFGAGGIAGRQFRMPDDLSATLFRATRIMLVAYPSLLMPWIIFRGPPFDFQALPRLGYTAYEVSVAAVLYYLIRDASPLVRHSFWKREVTGSGRSDVSQGLLADNWRLISSGIFLCILAVVGLDVMGYRFGAATMTRNGLATLVTLFLLIGGYRLSLSVVFRMGRDHRMVMSVAPGQEDRESRRRSALSIRKLLRLIFVVGGGLMLASYWGVNKQTLDALNEYTLLTATLADGSLDTVSVADLLRAGVILLLTFWLVRHLPSLFELLIFSRVRTDQGVRYATLTMTRYVVVLAGLPMALSALHVDVGKIAWLAAAISVGIGFGLQEIVANFVSGIILLLERPIRVGDRITVGAIMGEVRLINIRATRVLNYDCQEILIPNRDLITKEVINWTLSSKEVRLIVPIGVGYGSDVEQVRKLLLEVAKNDPLVLKDPAPKALFMNHGASALEFELRVFHMDPDNRSMIMDRMNTAINKILRANHIEIPFPQQDVHIRSGLPAPRSEVSPVETPPLEVSNLATGIV